MTKAFVESKPKSCLVHNLSIVTIQKRKKKKINNLSIMINGTRIVIGIMKGKPMSGRNITFREAGSLVSQGTPALSMRPQPCFTFSLDTLEAKEHREPQMLVLELCQMLFQSK